MLGAYRIDLSSAGQDVVIDEEVARSPKLAPVFVQIIQLAPTTIASLQREQRQRAA